jgi:signal peptidase II
MEKTTGNPFGKISLALLIIANLALDQITKLLVRIYVKEHEQIVLIKNRFLLTRVENDGAFLSFGSDLPNFVKLTLLNILPIAVLGYGLWYVFRYRNLSRISQFAITCLLGGGIGNIFDRMVYGSVTDFFFMDFYLFRTGVFNVADMSIMLGIGLMVFQAGKTQSNQTKLPE